MKQYAIVRTEKLKTLGAIAGSLSHTYRTRETLNAEVSRAAENEHTDQRPQEVMQAMKDRIPAKHRKDAVLALEYFIGASPEWFDGKTRDQEEAYFLGAVDWLKQRHGEENVVGWSIHRDESSPHLVAYVVPLDAEGKLNAKKWTGGAAALSRMQTDFAKRVGAKHGLERGIEGSKATHQKVKDWYAQIEKPSQHVTISPESVAPKIVKKGILRDEYETPEAVAARLTASVQAAYAPAVEKAKVVESERLRASEMARTAHTLADEKKTLLGRIEALESVFAPLLDLADLAKSEFDQLMKGAKERVRGLKAERQRVEAERQRVADIAAEKARRAAGMQELLQKRGGVTHVLAIRSIDALKSAGGDPSKVHWAVVEAQTVQESMKKHGQPAEAVIDAINRYSPGRADPASHQEIKDAVMRLAPAYERAFEERRVARSNDRGHNLD